MREKIGESANEPYVVVSYLVINMAETSIFLTGGLSGSRGRNLLLYKDGRRINLGGKASVKVDAGVCSLLKFYLYHTWERFITFLRKESICATVASLLYIWLQIKVTSKYSFHN